MKPAPRLEGYELYQMLETAARRNPRVAVTRFSLTFATVDRAVLNNHETGQGVGSLLLTLERRSRNGPVDYRMGDTIGVSLRISHKKCLFSTIVQEILRDPDGHHLIATWPDEAELIQRRAFERATPPANQAVPVRFAPTSATVNKRCPSMRFAQLENLSAGGMQVLSAESTAPTPGTLCQCIVTPARGAHALSLQALTRHRTRLNNNRASIGFQFVGLEQQKQRETLSRLLALVRQWQQANCRHDCQHS